MHSLSPPIVTCKRKYALEILKEKRDDKFMLMDTPMDPFLKLEPDQRESYSNHGR